MAYYESISIEELPSLGASRSLLPTLLPTSVDEEDDPRSLIYIFDDSDVQRAAAIYAMARAEARAEAEAEAEAERLLEQKHKQALAKQLEYLLDEDEAFVDLIGRRLLAINGYDVPDIWSTHVYSPAFGSMLPSHSNSSLRIPLFSDMHDDWDLDWLGRELLSGRQGANVWIIEADSSPLDHVVTAQQLPLTSQVEEDEQDRELPSAHVQAFESHAPTVTSEAEENMLETQGQPVDDDTHRPRKSIKVTDLRSS